MTRPRIVTFLFSLYCYNFFWDFLRHYPLGLTSCIYTIVYFIVTGSHSILMCACESFFCVLLSYQFTFFILLISKDVVMGWDRWWIGKHCILGFIVPLACSSTLFYPFWFLIVLPRTWYVLSSSRGHSSFFKSLHLRSETGMGFD